MIDFGKANLPQPGVDSVELVFHIPWGHNKLIIDKCKNNQENMWVIPNNAEKPEDGRALRYEEKPSNKAKPFLKWAGGKGQLLSEIQNHYPFDENINKYAEPFVGGGAVLFDILDKYR